MKRSYKHYINKRTRIITVLYLKTILLPCTADVKTEAAAKINTKMYLHKHT